jgi:DNA-binding response OmpR family regulator
MNPEYDGRVTGPPATILVVEDDADLRRLYRTALTLAGFVVHDVSIGLDALRRIDMDPPDLVVLDLMLPDISGLVIRQEIAAHAHTRNIPVVIVTGSTLDLKDIEVPCVLRKPVSPEELVRTVHSCLTTGAQNVDL